MKLRDIAKETRETIDDGVAWIIIYKVGRHWEYTETGALGDFETHEWEFADEKERQEVLRILEADPDAVIFNGYDSAIETSNLDNIVAWFKYCYNNRDFRLSNELDGITNAKVLTVVEPKEEPTENVEETQEETSTKFNTGMRFGTVEIFKRTDKMVYLKSLENGLRTKKKIKTSKDGVEYIDMDIDTCEWLGIAQDEEFFKYTTVHLDKYRNELVCRLFPKGGEINE